MQIRRRRIQKRPRKKEFRMADGAVRNAIDSVIGFARGIFSPATAKQAQTAGADVETASVPDTDPRDVIKMESNADGSVTVYHPDGSSERRAVIR